MAEVYRPYTFTLDGKPFEPTVRSRAGEPDRPRPGDLIAVGEIPFRLGVDRDLRFVMEEPYGATRLYLAGPGSQRRLVGLKEMNRWDDATGSYVPVNALARLSPQEIRGLHGLLLETWPPGTEQRLRHLSGGSACLEVNEEIAQGIARRLPDLPSGLTCLVLKETCSGEFGDLSAVVRLRRLEILVLNTCVFRKYPVDARLITGSQGLRYLDLSNQKLSHLDAIARLTDLRQLVVSGLDHTDLSFIRAMTRLRRLRLDASRFSSLQPMQGLQRLVEADAGRSAVTTLPLGPMPGLRRLRLILSNVPTAEASRFRATNPGCMVDHGMVDTLRSATSGADRVRVRTGGVCARRPAREKVAIDRRGVDAVSELLASLEVDEVGSGPRCLCCGHPTIELLRGEKVVAAVTVHHGRSLRWDEGWPTDAKLTAAGIERLATWMERSGYDELARDQAGSRRGVRYRQLIPAPVLAALLKSEAKNARLAAFDLVPAAADRARLVLRLFGCDLGSWNLYAMLDELFQDPLLGRLDTATWTTVLGGPLDDPDLVNGIARALFSEDLHGKVEPKILSRTLVAIARAGWSHPRTENRHLTIAALGRIGTPAAMEALRTFVKERPAPRPLPEALRLEPHGVVRSVALHQPPVEGASELAHAAYLLAKLGDRRSAPVIRKLAATATGPDRTLLGQAVELLDRRPARTPPRPGPPARR